MNIDLSGGWKMTVGDSAEYCDVTFNDSSWQTIDLPRILTKDKTRKIIWLRKTFLVPPEYRGKDIAIEIGRLWDADTTYVNGVKIGTSGSEFPDFFSLWNYDRYYYIPADAIHYGETNVVAIRIFSNCLSFFGGRPFIGGLRQVWTYNYIQRLLAEYLVIALTVLSFFFGFTTFVLYMTYRKFRTPLYYSIGSVLIGFMSVQFYLPDLVLIDYITKDNLFYAIMTLVIAFYYYLLENLLDARNMAFRVTVILAMLVAVGISLTSTSYDPVQNWRIIIIGSLTFMVYILGGILILRALTRSRVKWQVMILAAGYTVNMVCVCHDILMMNNLIVPGIFLIPAAFSFLFICLGLVLTLRISDMQVKKRIAEKSRDHYVNEITLAKRVQDQLIPSAPPAAYIHTLYKPMEDVGGDFYDFIHFEDSNKIGIFISDVSGHGLSAAFITSMIKTTILQSGDRKNDPAGLLLYINDVLLDQTAGNYITAFYGIYDPGNRSFRFSGAGHPAPFLITPHEITRLKSGRNTALAIFSSDHLRQLGKICENHELILPDESKLLLFTDGLIETCPAGGDNRTFESADMDGIFRENRKYHCVRFLDNLYMELKQFRGSDSFEDDICMVCLDVV